MSRFYDVLKGSKLSNRLPLEAAEAEGSDNLGTANLADILATFDETAPATQGSLLQDFSEPIADAAESDNLRTANLADILATFDETAPATQGSLLQDFSEPIADAAISVDPPKISAVEGIGQSQMPFPVHPISSNGSFGSPMQMRLDNRVRLIPNLVDALNIEQYRFLRTKILQRQADQMFRTLLVTSAKMAEGKSLTTLNLALTFAMLPSFRVLVVDGDLRKGKLQDLLGIQGHPGLADLLDGSATLEEVVCKADDIPVRFVVRGNSRLSPAELLHSSRLSLQLQEMAKHFDLVIVDSPPVNAVADAQLLAASSEAVLLVARACVTTQRDLVEAMKKLRRFRVIGTVLNGTTGIRDYRDDYYKS